MLDLQLPDVVAVQPVKLLEVEDRAGRADPFEIDILDELVEGEDLAAVRHERFIIPGSAAERDDHRLAVSRHLRGLQTRSHQGCAKARPGGVAKEPATTP